MKRVVALLLFTVCASAQHVTFLVPPLERPTTDTTIRAFAVLNNGTAADIANVTVAAYVLGGAYIGGESNTTWSCANHQNPYQLRCTTPLVRAGESLTLQIYAGPAVEGRFELSGYASWPKGEEHEQTLTSTQRVRFPRELVVTSANDSGDGSLRAAIEMLNDTCARASLSCDVSVRVEQPIVLETPLPPITHTDFRLYGNHATLDGAKLAAGHGLDIRGAGSFAVQDFTIARFPWDGIALARGAYCGENAIVTGNTLLANRSRGITLNEPSGCIDVVRNTIREQGRSGIFIAAGSGLRFAENTIEHNGASGIYAGPRCLATKIERNRIVHNGQFGVALDAAGQNVTLEENSIAYNALQGIDRALDGFDGYDYDDYALTDAKIPPPRVTSATYDAVSGTTLITGLAYDDDRWGWWTPTLYANDVAGPHGDVILGHPTVQNGTFAFRAAGDLRGRFITANTTRYLNLGWSGSYSWTSEFSDWVEVLR